MYQKCLRISLLLLFSLKQHLKRTLNRGGDSNGSVAIEWYKIPKFKCWCLSIKCIILLFKLIGGTVTTKEQVHFQPAFRDYYNTVSIVEECL